ncbi:hypothetical protein [Nitrospira sp. Nam74]
MWWSLFIIMVGFVPVQARALRLQDRVDQRRFTAGDTNFSNFTASTHIATFTSGALLR